MRSRPRACFLLRVRGAEYRLVSCRAYFLFATLSSPIDHARARARACIGRTYTRHNHAGHNYIGHNYNVQTSRHNWKRRWFILNPDKLIYFKDDKALRHNYIGHSYIGHNYIGHNYIEHYYTGHSCIGHNYTGHDLFQGRQGPAP